MQAPLLLTACNVILVDHVMGPHTTKTLNETSRRVTDRLEGIKVSYIIIPILSGFRVI